MTICKNFKKGENNVVVRDSSGKAILMQDEIDCRCKLEDCKITRITEPACNSFRLTREEFDSPIWTTSVFRCVKHNDSVGGVKGSNHTHGDALDMIPVNGDLDRLEKIARKHFKYVKRYKNFIHGDNRFSTPTNRIILK